jgi:Grx4 family monothiol glutaredoxin
LRGARLRWPLFRDILRIGAVPALITFQTNLTIAVTTALVGSFGPAAIAGYGVGARLEYLLVPLVFGLGGPLVAMVGTSIGAGRRERAVRTAWIGAAIAVISCEIIGLAAASAPGAWLSLFDSDQTMLDAGSQYLHVVGPFYGFFGLGLALYCASQGAGRLLWPLLANLARLVIAAGGGWFALRWGGDLTLCLRRPRRGHACLRPHQCRRRGGRRLVRPAAADIRIETFERHCRGRMLMTEATGTGRLHADTAEIINTYSMVLFMKGTPARPQCGFSTAVVEVLRHYDVPIHAVDVLADPAIRHAIKTYSGWPTIPQLYLNGTFLGGCDIVRETHEPGELAELIAGNGTEGSS